MPPPTTPPTQPVEQYLDFEFLTVLKNGQEPARRYLDEATRAGWRLALLGVGYVVFERTMDGATFRAADFLARWDAVLREIADLPPFTPDSAEILRLAINRARNALGRPPVGSETLQEGTQS